MTPDIDPDVALRVAASALLIALLVVAFCIGLIASVWPWPVRLWPEPEDEPEPKIHPAGRRPCNGEIDFTDEEVADAARTVRDR